MTVTCSEMKAIEKCADENGISYYQMMENAGTAAFREIIRHGIPSKAAVFCGRGNNGGDGFVISRLLISAGVRVEIMLVDGEPQTPDAITNFGLISGAVICDEPEGDIFIDAIYGTGFHGRFKDRAKSAVDYINRSGRPVYAVDIPSGLSGDMTDNDRISDEPVRASYTIAFHDTKPVHTCSSAAPYLGEVITVSIGIEDAIHNYFPHK